MKNDKNKTKKKRAIALAGGGPAAGLHIGVLKALEDAGIDFDIYSLSCIGAWVGIVYNTRTPPNRAEQTLAFFRDQCFRDDASFSWFPINRGFAADMQAQWKAWAAFPFSNRREWQHLVQPKEIGQGVANTMKLATDPSRWTPQQFNAWMLNDVLAVNPFTRYMTSLIYNAEINGLSKVYYDDSPVLAEVFREGRLFADDAPEIYHNAWRLPKEGVDGAPGTPGRMQIFHNRPQKFGKGERDYLKIQPKSLCACSALPYIEESVVIDGDEYTEGALVDTVNFKNLLRDHPDLDEVWVNRIVDDSQVRPARTLADSLANLPMQFAAEVGENDIKLFRQHLINQTRMRPRVVEVPIVPDTKVNFEWKRSNLMRGYEEGQQAIQALLRADPQLRESTLA